MKVVADKLTTALDSVTTTVNNTNDVVTGIKQGRGTIGMLLRDEKTARTYAKRLRTRVMPLLR